MASPLLLRRFLDRLHFAVADLHWSVLGAAAATHALASWAMLAVAGEEKLTPASAYIYWYATTAFTVGYGDLSPQTAAGRLLTAAFIFPGAIAIFTTIVAKTLNGLANFWRRRRNGKGDYRRMSETIVLVGFDPSRTPKMIDELHADLGGRSRIVLLTHKELADPDPRAIYVRARSLTAHDDLTRAGVQNASRIAVFADTDAETLAAALAVAAQAQSAHIVAYFQDRDSAHLLALHCPRVECIVSPGPELVMRSVQDPGASRVLSALISQLDDSATLFSLRWPADRRATFREAAQRFLDEDATLLAWQGADDLAPSFHIKDNMEVGAGARLFYVAERRLAGFQEA